MAEVLIPSATTVASFIATKILLTASGKKNSVSLSAEEFANAVSEIELETQIKGASFIKVHLIDPNWKIATSGLVDVNAEGLLPEAEAEFPEKSGWIWTLCAVEVTNDFSSGANLILTFEDKIVNELRQEWGLKRAKPGYNARAQFIKSLIHEVSLHGKPAIRSRIPSAEGAADTLDKEITAIKQAVENLESGGGAVATPEAEGIAAAQQNKSGGISGASGVTVKGAKADSEQIATMNEALGFAAALKAGQLATEALVTACIVESEFRKNASGGGLLQFEVATAKGKGVEPGNVGQEVDAVLNDPGATGKGGMISLARQNPNSPAWKIAQEEQGSGAGAASEGQANYGPWVGEAKAIIAAYGGVGAGGGASGGGAPAQSTAGELARGTTENPDEDSWDCIQRLAGDVNWFAFTNGHTLYYLDGPELAAQKPSLYVNVPANTVSKETARGKRVTESAAIQVPLTATFDNTTLEYLQDRKVHGKVQKRSRTAKPQTPSEIRMNLVCDITAYRAGEVFYFVDSGPLNGRWIITDATRNCLKDTFTQFILEPPSAPIAESEDGTPESQPEVPTASGGAEGVVNAAEKALAERTKYVYSEGADRGNNGTLYGPAPRTMDCSAFATLCYKEAGLEDPSGQNYNPIGDTDSMIRHMVKTSSPKPGDVAFFGTSESATKHVNVVVGGGESINMGGPGDPDKGPTKAMGPGESLFLGYWTLP